MNFLSIKPLTMNIYALPGYRQTLSLVTWKKKTFVFLIILIDFITYFITEWISLHLFSKRFPLIGMEMEE